MAEKEVKWIEAIEIVLEDAKTTLHYKEITEKIYQKGLRIADGGNSDPKSTVHKIITDDIYKNGNKSKFLKVSEGHFIFRKYMESTKNTPFGICWDIEKVDWSTTVPDLWGCQSKDSRLINFSNQIGIYLLHDNRGRIIYVGKTERSISQRLKEHYSHSRDNLVGKWNKFSWFGLHLVNENGEIVEKGDNKEFSNTQMLAYLEGILIESIDPPENYESAKNFNKLEFFQK